MFQFAKENECSNTLQLARLSDFGQHVENVKAEAVLGSLLFKNFPALQHLLQTICTVHALRVELYVAVSILTHRQTEK